MKNFGMIFFVVIVFTGTFISCNMDSNVVEEPSREEEQAGLSNYIETLIEKGSDVDTTELGVYYITLDEGTGDFPKMGDTLSVKYAGYFNSGLLFDTSDWLESSDSTFTFVLGEKPMIEGWEDGMKVINKDARVQLIVSSDFAYGADGGGIIPPYQTLVFVVIMKEIKPSN